MKPAAIFKFIFKLFLLEAFVILVIDAIYLVVRNDFDRLVLLLPVATLFSLLFTSPFAMLIYLLLAHGYGFNNKILLHATHALLFVGVSSMFRSGASGDDGLIMYIPSAAVVVAVGVVIYMKSPKVQSELREPKSDSTESRNLDSF